MMGDTVVNMLKWNSQRKQLLVQTDQLPLVTYGSGTRMLTGSNTGSRIKTKKLWTMKYCLINCIIKVSDVLHLTDLKVIYVTTGNYSRTMIYLSTPKSSLVMFLGIVSWSTGSRWAPCWPHELLSGQLAWSTCRANERGETRQLVSSGPWKQAMMANRDETTSTNSAMAVDPKLSQSHA